MDSNKIANQISQIIKSLETIRCSVLDESLVMLDKARTPEQVEEFVRKGICLRCEEKMTKKPNRGVHDKCYQKLRRADLIDAAVANGQLLPVEKPGPKAEPALVTVTKNSRQSKGEAKRNDNSK